jgi:hypothetical protein
MHPPTVQSLFNHSKGAAFFKKSRTSHLSFAREIAGKLTCLRFHIEIRCMSIII